MSSLDHIDTTIQGYSYLWVLGNHAQNVIVRIYWKPLIKAFDFVILMVFHALTSFSSNSKSEEWDMFF